MKTNLFDDFADTPSSVVPHTTKPVPNVQPRITNVPYRLAIIGEAPGVDEADQGIPFIGYSGQLLDKFLSRFNILRDACFIGNVCQLRPFKNRIAEFDWDGEEIQSGLSKLRDDLKTFKPNVVLLLGGSALHAFKEDCSQPVRKKKTKEGPVFDFPNSIGDWRGSFFECYIQGVLPGVKCIAAYHPAACLRQYEWSPLLMMDIQRAFKDSTFPELNLPQRQLFATLTFQQLWGELDKIIAEKPSVGTDIEGYWNNLRCICFAPKPEYSFTVPFTKMNGESYWTLEEEVILTQKVAAILADTKIVKVWQNGLYDRFVLQYGYNMIVRGPSSDIMLKTWELYSELPKGLGDQASIYTREPYWKGDRLQAEEKS